jgi:hypothetical protein
MSLAPFHQTVFPAVVSQLPLAGGFPPLLRGSQINGAVEARPIPRVKQNAPKREKADVIRIMFLFIEVRLPVERLAYQVNE